MLKIKFISFIKQYKFNSIILRNFIKLFFVFVMILIIPCTIIYQINVKGTYDNAKKENEQQIQKLSSASETVFRDTEYLASAILSEKDISIFISLNENSPFLEDSIEKVSKIINSYMGGRPNIYSIYIYSQRNNHICTTTEGVLTQDFADMSWRDYYLDGFENLFKVIPRKIGRYPNVFTFIKKSDNLAGAVIINVDTAAFDKTIDNVMGNSTNFYIVNNDGIIYSKEKNKSLSNLQTETKIKSITGNPGIVKINGDPYTTNFETSKYYYWKYVGVSSFKEYEIRLKFMNYFLWGVALLFLAFVAASSLFLSASSLNQVANIVDLIDNKDKVANYKENEITYLTNKIIGVIDDNDRLKQEINKRISEYEKLNLLTLQAQINPHFLNNTLTAINDEITNLYGYNTVPVKMIVKLSRLLHYCFVTEEMLVPICKEIVFLEKYMDLLTLRCGEFKREIKIEDSIFNCKILKLTLQPIVENAVFHGIKSKGRDGSIKISGYALDENIVIKVEDNGNGMSQNEIESIMDSFQNSNFDKQNIGIKNIYRRLKLIYGERANLKIESELGKYTKVTVEIPKNHN